MKMGSLIVQSYNEISESNPMNVVLEQISLVEQHLRNHHDLVSRLSEDNYHDTHQERDHFSQRDMDPVKPPVNFSQAQVETDSLGAVPVETLRHRLKQRWKMEP